MTDQMIQIAGRLLEIRETLRRFHGEKYAEKIEPFRRLLRGKSRGPLATALETIKQMQADGCHEMMILAVCAAAADVTDEEGSASACQEAPAEVPVPAGHAISAEAVPWAEALSLSYIGRKLFRVEGRSGLWCCMKDSLEPNAESIIVRLRGPRGRSRGQKRSAVLYYVASVTEQARAALQPQAAATAENAEPA